MTNEQPMFTTTHREVAETSQAIILKEQLAYGEHKIRVTIKSDAYKAQCKAVLEVWSQQALQWNKAAYINPTAMATKHGVSYEDQQMKKGSSWYSKDRATLLQQFAQLVNT